MYLHLIAIFQFVENYKKKDSKQRKPKKVQDNKESR